MSGSGFFGVDVFSLVLVILWLVIRVLLDKRVPVSVFWISIALVATAVWIAATAADPFEIGILLFLGVVAGAGPGAVLGAVWGLFAGGFRGAGGGVAIGGLLGFGVFWLLFVLSEIVGLNFS